MKNIHDYHDSMPASEAAQRDKSAETQEQIVLQILRGSPDQRFAYFDIISMTGYDKDSAKRALSNLSGSGNEAYQDECDRWPVVYDPKKRKKNPKTGATCGTYRANPEYGNPPEPTGQVDAFGSPQVKYKQGIGL